MSPINAGSRDLAEALAGGLSQIVPDGFTVLSDNSDVVVYSGGRSLCGSAALAIIDADDGRTLQEKIETAVIAAVTGVQDCIIEALQGPWPGKSTRGPDLPLPDCRIEGSQLKVWFGEESRPDAVIPPITLT